MTEKFTNFFSFLENKKSFVLVFDQRSANLDLLAFVTSFYLLSKKNDLTSYILSLYLPKVADTILFAIDKVKSQLPKQNLVLKFAYNQNLVDKITYQVDEKENQFLLTIKPQKNFHPLDFSQINHFYSGAKTDGVILCNVSNPNNLGKIYQDYKEIFSNKENLFYLNFNFKSSYSESKNNFLDLSDFSSWTEFLGLIIKEKNLIIDNDLSTNLITGIDFQSYNLTSSKTSANTFEIFAWLLRQGGERKLLIRENKLQKNNDYSVKTKSDKKLVEMKIEG